MPNSGDVSAPTMYCRACSYVLDGLTEYRCPECGRAFDPAMRRTYRTRPPALRLRKGLWSLALLLVLLASYFGWRYEAPRAPRPGRVRVRFDPSIPTDPSTVTSSFIPLMVVKGRTAYMAFGELEIGGRFSVRHKDGPVLFEILLVDGDDDKLNLKVSEPDGTARRLSLVRDQSVPIEVKGESYTLTYPSRTTASSQPVIRGTAGVYVIHER